MAFRIICVALLLASLPIAGCGTVANLARQGLDSGGVIPFGGVKQDVACMKKAENGEFSFCTQPKPEPEQRPQVAVMLLCAADLPLSLIGDIVTWPYTATYTYINQPSPTPPVMQPPTPPVTQATTPPVTQATPAGRPQTSPYMDAQNPASGGR